MEIKEAENKMICFKGFPEDFSKQTEKLRQLFENKNIRKEDLIFILETLELQEIKTEKYIENKSLNFKEILFLIISVSAIVISIITITILLLKNLLIL